MAKGVNVLLGFLAGAAIGAAAGILYAPDKGSRTRRRIAREARDFAERTGDTVTEKINDLRDDVADFLDNLSDRISDLEERVRKGNVSEQVKQAAAAAKDAVNEAMQSTAKK